MLHLSTIQKFYYLRSSLKDEAARVIQNLEISIDNYEVAWTLLRNRYANKKLLIKKHIVDLLDIKVVPKEFVVTRTFGQGTDIKNYS